MRFKRLISIILILVFVFSQSLIVFAEDDSSSENWTLGEIIEAGVWSAFYTTSEGGVPLTGTAAQWFYPGLSDNTKAWIAQNYGINDNSTLEELQLTMDTILWKSSQVVDVLRENGDLLVSIDKNGKKQIKLSAAIGNALVNKLDSLKPKMLNLKTTTFDSFTSRANFFPLDFRIGSASAYSSAKNRLVNDNDFILLNYNFSWDHSVGGAVFPEDSIFVISSYRDFNFDGSLPDKMDIINRTFLSPVSLANSTRYGGVNIHVYDNTMSTPVLGNNYYSFAQTTPYVIGNLVDFALYSEYFEGDLKYYNGAWFVSDTPKVFSVFYSINDAVVFLGHNSSVVQFKDVNIDPNNFSFTFDSDIDYSDLIDSMYDIYKNGDWVTADDLNNLFSKQLQEINNQLHDINNSLNNENGYSWLRLIYEYLKNNVDSSVYEEIIDILNDIKNNNSSCDHSRIEELLELISENIGSDVSVDTTQIENLLQQIIDNMPNGSSSDVELDRIEELLEQLVNKSSSDNSSQLQQIIDLLTTTNLLLGINDIQNIIPNDDLDWLDITNLTKDMNITEILSVVNQVGSNRFPFTITNDFALILSVLHEKSEKPDFNYPINFLGHETSFNVNFDYYDTYARKYVEFFIILVFICGLLPVTISLVDTFKGD